ncbi:MAG: hypothetical protein ACP5MD_16530 [Verrucomicrobiia bacterium]
MTFTIGFDGSAPLAFQWYSNNVAITDATSYTYSIARVPLSANGAKYKCTVSNALARPRPPKPLSRLLLMSLRPSSFQPRAAPTSSAQSSHSLSRSTRSAAATRPTTRFQD